MKKLKKEDILTNIKAECNVYSNFGYILEKVQQDGTLENIYETLEDVFIKEISYAKVGKIKRTYEIKK